MKYSIHITDDHELFADGLKIILTELDNIELAGISKTGKDCIFKLRTNPPDILLLDLNLPDLNGADILDFIVKNAIATKVIVISMHYDPAYINLARKRGASGYVPKNVDKHHLFKALNIVISGSTYFEYQNKTFLESKIQISTRELEILRLLYQGLPSKKIADILFISIETVKKHRKNLLEKNEMSTTLELIKFAQSKGLI